MLAIGIAQVPLYARLVRGAVLRVKALDYVAAARAVGSGDGRILWRHVLPNCLAAGARAVHALLRHRHPLRRVPGLPRPGGPAAHPRVGHHAEQGPRLPAGRAPRLGVPRPHHHADGARPQPARRRPARRAGPAHRPAPSPTPQGDPYALSLARGQAVRRGPVLRLRRRVRLPLPRAREGPAEPRRSRGAALRPARRGRPDPETARSAEAPGELLHPGLDRRAPPGPGRAHPRRRSRDRRARQHARGARLSRRGAGRPGDA